MSELPVEVRDDAINLLIESALADGVVVDAERDYLAAVARAAGISNEVIEKRIAARLAEMSKDG